MTRLLSLIALIVLAYLFFARWIPRLRGGNTPRVRRAPSPDSVICAQCHTEYNPSVTGWMCPKCRK